MNFEQKEERYLKNYNRRINGRFINIRDVYVSTSLLEDCFEKNNKQVREILKTNKIKYLVTLGCIFVHPLHRVKTHKILRKNKKLF